MDIVTIKGLRPFDLIPGKGEGQLLKSQTSSLLVVLEGEAKAPKFSSLTKGTVLFIPENFSFEIFSVTKPAPYLLALETSFNIYGLDASYVLPKVPTKISQDSDFSLYKDICKLTREDSLEGSIVEAAKSLSLKYRIISSLCLGLNVEASPTLSRYQDEDVRQLMNYLESNYQRDLDVQEIADACYISRRQLFKVAARIDNQTPARLLKKIRLEKSRSLLLNRDLSISEIAFRVGFNSNKSFTREFKKTYDLLPREYRQKSHVRSHVKELIQSGDGDLRSGNLKRAAEKYLKAGEDAKSWGEADALHFKAGKALWEAGDLEAASLVWKKITSLNYRLKVNLKSCEVFNKVRRYEVILEKLEECYAYGNREMQEEVVSRLGDWMLDCAISKKYESAVAYSKFAIKVLKTHPSIEGKLARALFLTGQFMSVIEHCPNSEFHVASAMRATGHYAEHLQRFPDKRTNCASILYRMGRYEEILSDYPEESQYGFYSLVQLGRIKEAIKRFPEQKVPALIVSRKYSKILKDFPDELEACTWAKIFLGQEGEALELCESSADLSSRVLVYLRKPEEILKGKHAQEYLGAAKFIEGMTLIQKGEMKEGLSRLEEIIPMTAPDRLQNHVNEFTDMLVPCVFYLVGIKLGENKNSHWSSWLKHFNRVVRDHRYVYSQEHWYGLRFLLDEIDEESFLNQPNKAAASIGISFVKGLKAEFLNQGELALEHYDTFKTTVEANQFHFPTHAWSYSTRLAFLEWRAEILRR